MADLVGGFHRGAVDGIADDITHEAPVNLQIIHVQRLEITEGAQAGAEIIERKAAAHAFEYRDELGRTRKIHHRRGFRDLETDLLGRDNSLIKGNNNEMQKISVAQRLTREIDGKKPVRGHGGVRLDGLERLSYHP